MAKEYSSEASFVPAGGKGFIIPDLSDIPIRLSDNYLRLSVLTADEERKQKELEAKAKLWNKQSEDIQNDMSINLKKLADDRAVNYGTMAEPLATDRPDISNEQKVALRESRKNIVRSYYDDDLVEKNFSPSYMGGKYNRKTGKVIDPNGQERDLSDEEINLNIKGIVNYAKAKKDPLAKERILSELDSRTDLSPQESSLRDALKREVYKSEGYYKISDIANEIALIEAKLKTNSYQDKGVGELSYRGAGIEETGISEQKFKDLTRLEWLKKEAAKTSGTTITANIDTGKASTADLTKEYELKRASDASYSALSDIYQKIEMGKDTGIIDENIVKPIGLGLQELGLDGSIVQKARSMQEFDSAMGQVVLSIGGDAFKGSQTQKEWDMVRAMLPKNANSRQVNMAMAGFLRDQAYKKSIASRIKVKAMEELNMKAGEAGDLFAVINAMPMYTKSPSGKIWSFHDDVIRKPKDEQIKKMNLMQRINFWNEMNGLNKIDFTAKNNRQRTSEEIMGEIRY